MTSELEYLLSDCEMTVLPHPNAPGIAVAMPGSWSSFWQMTLAAFAVLTMFVGNLVYAAGEVPGRSGTFAPLALDLGTGELAWYGVATA